MKRMDASFIFYTSLPPEMTKRFHVYSTGYFKAGPNFNLDRSKGHLVEHLIVTHDGRAEGDIMGQHSIARPGSIWLMPKDKPYRYWTMPPDFHWEGRWIEYDGEWAQQIWTMMRLDGVSHVPGCREAIPIAERIHDIFRTRGNAGANEAAALLLRILALAERRHHEQAGAEDSAATGIERAIEYIHAHYAEPVSLDELAEIARLSPFHFSRVFREKTGRPPATYVRSIRMSRARELLREGKLSVKEIGVLVGYPVIQHFCGAFKKAAGTSPQKFLKSHRG